MKAPTGKKIGNAITFAVLGRLYHCGAFCNEAVADFRSESGKLFDLVEETVESVLHGYPIDEMGEVFVSRENARASVIKWQYKGKLELPEYLIRLHEYADQRIAAGAKQVWHEVGVYNRDFVNKVLPNDLNLLDKNRKARTTFRNEHNTIWSIVRRERAWAKMVPHLMLTAMVSELLPNAFDILEEKPGESDDVKFAREQFELLEKLPPDALSI